MTDLATVVGVAASQENFLPVILILLNDPVANVRFTAIRAAQSMQPAITSSGAASQFTVCLQKLCEDKDSDVSSSAQQALVALQRR